MFRDSPSAPSVSIVIPCWNCECTVGDAIESALNQEYPTFEVVVVDDGSTDRSLGVAIFGPGVTVLTGEKRGACAARNEGISYSSGKYLQFLDSDDILLPDKLSRQVALCEESGAAIVAGSYLHTGSYRSAREVPAERRILGSLCLRVEADWETPPPTYGAKNLWRRWGDGTPLGPVVRKPN